MRIFIASKINNNYLEKISEIFIFFKKLKIERKLKPVELNNIHLTHFFLGDILNEEKLNILKKSFEIF